MLEKACVRLSPFWLKAAAMAAGTSAKESFWTTLEAGPDAVELVESFAGAPRAAADWLVLTAAVSTTVADAERTGSL